MQTSTIYMIHGWAVNAAIFRTFRAALPAEYRVQTPNLMGHGDECGETFSIERAVQRLSEQWSEPVHLLGWSLGGLIALHLASRYPEKVKSLILCSTFARLYADKDYPEGVKTSVLDKMAVLFHNNYAKQVQQFLELQLIHTPERQEIIAEVLPDLLKHGSPTALNEALIAIQMADARHILPSIHVPVLLLYGNKDAVTPVRMGEYLLRHLPNACLSVVDKAAHAPFLSHTADCVRILMDFIQKNE